MAETLMPRLLLGALAWMAAAGGACAQEASLPDPTRPPAVLSAPAAAAPGRAASAAPQLQSVLISQRAGGRRVAVIDGKTLREGERVDGAIVEAIRPTEVVLRKGNQRQVLKLFRPARDAAA